MKKKEKKERSQKFTGDKLNTAPSKKDKLM